MYLLCNTIIISFVLERAIRFTWYCLRESLKVYVFNQFRLEANEIKGCDIISAQEYTILLLSPAIEPEEKKKQNIAFEYIFMCLLYWLLWSAYVSEP